MARIVLSLGSNIEPREEHLKKAIAEIADWSESALKVSNMYSTEPVGFRSEKDFLNLAVLFETSCSPAELLAKIHAVESKMGRIRTPGRVEDRIIDMDILFYDDLVLNTDELSIPHPRLHERSFVLTPLLDIVPDLVHPILNKTIWELYDECKDLSEVSIVE
ncbi:MAG: 2-amino-4-hydroxy-6-hydroxymethyldihydropteridine diphosphokinase [Saprospiraceae bacterium]|nr:MAG: 2-amino-4-hydroxy-6- hydroxymethyldihydropteridine pyrophosphokinase [Candidatus Parvibacillus calidus]MCC7148395.1 2-amino-4-hydroxy-6-hydroxymethyldihydropteridine diphosphokinase [Saprospiraceae bacterium]WKZ63272.1 MAG: 2-amino-4-hydroxy-6-hydroxymethyldihydropteridine diphosphokinase [Saprospiraceae bacterium]